MWVLAALILLGAMGRPAQLTERLGVGLCFGVRFGCRGFQMFGDRADRLRVRGGLRGRSECGFVVFIGFCPVHNRDDGILDSLQLGNDGVSWPDRTGRWRARKTIVLH